MLHMFPVQIQFRSLDKRDSERNKIITFLYDTTDKDIKLYILINNLPKAQNIIIAKVTSRKIRNSKSFNFQKI